MNNIQTFLKLLGYLIILMPMAILSCKSDNFEFVIRVYEVGTNNGVSNATVALEISGQPPFNRTTDSEGIARILVDSSYIEEPAKLVVTAIGYESYSREIDLFEGALPEIIQLSPIMESTEPNSTEIEPIHAQQEIQQISFEVLSDKPWQYTDVIVHEGDVVTVSYVTGSWTVWKCCADHVDASGHSQLNPFNGFIEGARNGVLIGNIGGGEAFEIGIEKQWVSNSSGKLWLRINDENLVDNVGSITVQISVK